MRLSLAANMASGLNQWPHTGADDMFFHPGIATRNGLTAARLAELGAYGSEKALDGEAGLLTAMRPDRHAPPITLFDGEPEIMSVFFKPVPVCNFAQTPALAAIDLAPGRALRSGDIEAVQRARLPCCQGLSGLRPCRTVRAHPASQDEHPLCRGERALLDGRIDEDSYRDLDDAGAARARRQGSRSRRTTAYTAAFPQRQGATVEVRLNGGGTCRARCPTSWLRTSTRCGSGSAWQRPPPSGRMQPRRSRRRCVLPTPRRRWPPLMRLTRTAA